MNILLINNNPVVSRLLMLCTRDESMILEEIRDLNEIKRDSYDIVFVDEALYEGKVQNLSGYVTTQKKVLFTNIDSSLSTFDVVIQKPFLPSQVLEVIESLNDKKNQQEQEEDNAQKTQVLDDNEVEKIKELLDMNEMDYDSSDEILSDEAYESRKIKAIKEQLIAEGLEIVEEKEMLDDFDVDAHDDEGELSNEDNLFLDKVKRKKMKNKSTKKKKKKLAHKEEDLIVQALEIAIRTLKKKQRKQLLKGKEVEITIRLEDRN